MPPLRTFTPIKAIKTERTHEENQERAYIAASRRSDRSLEARVESARRASEIHKRRTGRSLRVTEQDVINEEMYEEEDDDLPHQYRRLTAHLQTGSADFNRRLAAYLTNNVAMRSALDQAITSSYAQQFPNAPHFAHNTYTGFPSPLSAQPNMESVSSLRSQQSPQSPHHHTYRQSPYPMPGMAGYRQHSHGRTSSMHGSTKQTRSPVSPVSASVERNFSMPTPIASPAQVAEPLTSPTTQRKSPHIPDATPATEPQQDAAVSYAQSISPLTTTLPAESQMLLGRSIEQTQPFNSLFMANNDYSSFLDNDFFGSSSKESNFYPNLEGMNSTLAPSLSQQTSSFTSPDSIPAPTSSHFDQFNFDNLKGHEFVTTSDTGSGQVTPGIDGTWDAFIDDNGSWAENAT